ncbi:MAG: protealysin inhibitor emfourin [Pseudolysinimonas sp.]
MTRRDERSDPRLTILVARSGGFAGIRREWRLDDLGDDWRSLVDACPWGTTTTDETSRDRFVWLIEVRTGRRRLRAQVPERDLDGPWRELVERVRSEAGDE